MDESYSRNGAMLWRSIRTLSFPADRFVAVEFSRTARVKKSWPDTPVFQSLTASFFGV